MHQRHTKNRFRRYKEDRNPEHQRFVRKKSRIEYVDLDETWQNNYKNWKNNTKKRKQWM